MIEDYSESRLNLVRKPTYLTYNLQLPPHILTRHVLLIEHHLLGTTGPFRRRGARMGVPL